jgi:hypothetical protein
MTSEQSQEGQEIKPSSENEKGKESMPSPIEEGGKRQESGKQQSEISDVLSQEQDDDDESLIADILPPEMLEGLPPEAKRQVSLSFMAMRGSTRQSSPLAKQIKPEHITQIIANSEKESQREFEKSKIGENTKRWGMGAILSLVVIVFAYAGVTGDRELSEKVVVAGISAIGGFGAGYAIAKDKS